MENFTDITTQAPVSASSDNPASAVLRRWGRFLLGSLRQVGSCMADPMTCSAYWIGSSQSIWGAQK